MLFDIDLNKYRIVDLSLGISAPGTEDRPFHAEVGYLPDKSFKHKIQTHTHVGTHIESPSHFFEGARRLEGFPLNAFYGRAVLCEFAGVECEPVDGAAMEADIGSIVRPGDIVVFRNSHPEWRRVHTENRLLMPYLCADGAQWLAEKKVKMIVIDDFTGILVANGVETARANHDILLAPGVEILIMEFPSGVEQLTRKEFFVMALPVKFEGIDSMWTRAIAIEER